MPFRRITFDDNGQAGTSTATRSRVYVLNDSSTSVTIIDGADNFTLQPRTYARWTPDSEQLSFTGTANANFLFAWGDFQIDLLQPPFTFDNQKQLEVSLYDSLGNALPTFTANPGSTQRALAARLIRSGVVDLIVSLAAGSIATPTAYTSVVSNQQSSGGAGVATSVSGAWRMIVMWNIGAGDVDIGPSSVTFGTGFRLKANTFTPVAFGSTEGQSGVTTLFCIDNGITAGTVSFLALN